MQEVDPSEPKAGDDHAQRVIQVLGATKALQRHTLALRELAHLAEAPAEPAPGADREEERGAEPLGLRVGLERSHDVPEQRQHPPKVTQHVVALGEPEVGHSLEGRIAQRASDGEGALARVDGSLVMPKRREVIGEVSEDQSEPSLVAESLGDQDRKSTRLNSSHDQISYAVFCLK